MLSVQHSLRKSALLMMFLIVSVSSLSRVEAEGTWSLTGTMNTAPVEHSATLLSDGRVLVSGGISGGASLASTEIHFESRDHDSPLWP